MPVKTAPDIERQIGEAVDRLPFRVAGLWVKMRHYIEHQCDGRPGELRKNGTPLDADVLADKARSTAAKVSPLLDKLHKAGLIDKTADGAWYAPSIAKIAHLRNQQRDRVNRLREKRTVLGKRALRNARKGVTCAPSNARVTPCVTPDPPPPPSLPPTTPLSTPTPTPPFPSETSAAGKPPTEDVAEKLAAAGKPTHEYRQLTDFWQEQWAKGHGGEAVKFQRSDGVMISALWSRVGLDLPRAKAVISCYLADRSPMYEGHPLTLLKRDVLKFISRAKSAGANGAGAHGNLFGKRSPADRGEFTTSLPTGSRSLSTEEGEP